MIREFRSGQQVVPIRLIRSKRKTVSIQIASAEEVIIRAPLRMPESEIIRFLEMKRDWIETHLARAAKRFGEGNNQGRLTDREIQELTKKARASIPIQTEQRAQLIGVRYGRITIRHQRTRWGSCSSKGNLNYNCLLMLCPENVIDYVIVHELCHRKEMNHSARFWNEVEAIIPEYRKARKWLKENGPAILARIPV